MRVAVIGAGAAGVMAAIFAASRGADTWLLERTKDGGRKILISGGGRCNILPAHVDESRFVTDSSPHALRRILRSWPLREQIAFFERELRLPLVEEVDSGKLFPRSQRAREVRDTLVACARQKGVQIVTGSLVTGVTPSGHGWTIARDAQDPLEAEAVVLATGGLSVPSTGSDGLGLRIAAQLGHVINPTYPALTPLVSRDPRFVRLAGVSLPVTIAARSEMRRADAHGGLLFTHRGYSGPAVLDVSHVAVRSVARPATVGSATQDPACVPGPDRATITVQWSTLADTDWDERLRTGRTRTVAAALAGELPHRLCEVLLDCAGVDPVRRLSQLTRAERRRIVDTLVRSRLPWNGDEGYSKAEVTGGGVSLADVDPRTLESRRCRKLFLCGEMLDAFGPIGGYNFLWAWATGRAAGIGASE